ncbi:phosphoglucosamine mutase [Thiocystis violascens]|uniref:Phosphoglucosamine mutase n=1 Tax=Thiocystis violascens (strain ATCC 17096 / DSM 198 / 6111) TaxID=765911 RepID=I3Y7K4_THIV6|nr:phosphoglucosamine mutase [Thiocystis violascens]AFL72972.1 phosphoglucosamine mutase [Thiocystis violascens DSM 198]
MRHYFGTDGIRGRVGEGYITPDFVLKLGWAAGRVLGNGRGKILIGKDTRISGYMFESALEAGLVAAGVSIRLLGPMTTPGVAYLTRTFRASAGIVITASHNPYQDNGIKFFSADGDKLPDEVELAIEAELDKPLRTVASSELGKVQRVEDANGRYIEFCKGTIPASMNFRDYKIVVDCANGATYNTAPHVFEELGAQVVRLGTEPDGFNINREVGSTKPEALCRAVVEQGATLGIAFDGDGDRVLMCDSRGHLLDGDQLIYIIAKSRKMAGTMRGEVVGTLMSNLGFEHALTRLDIGFARTRVGDRYIMEQLKLTDGILGGEPSGHIICRDRTSTGDGIVAALQVLAALQRLDAGIDELCAEVELYPQVLLNVRLDERRDIVGLPAIQDALATAERELAGRGRVLLRPSGTEPLVRVMVEGVDDEQVSRLAEWLANAVREQIAL